MERKCGKNLKNMDKQPIDNILVKLRNKSKSIPHYLYVDYGNYRDTIFLAGSGGSGTTWLQEMINYKNEYHILFEPFHSKYVKELKDWNYRQYLRPTNQDPKYIEPAKCILSGKIRNKWINKFNRRIISHKRIIKDIRANFLLRWIHDQFQGIPIVLILRHPCAVANSRLILKWNTHFKEIFQQNDLVTDYFDFVKKEAEDMNDPFEKHIFMWCLENYVPLKQFKENEILITFYEDLCVNFPEESERIFNYLGKSLPKNPNDLMQKPSSMSRKDSPIKMNMGLVNSWRKNVTDGQIGRAIEIMKLFGLDAIYGEQDMPKINTQEVLKIL